MIIQLSYSNKMGVHERIYNSLVRKNKNVQREYERYVMEHTIEHYENRMKHWKILFKLNWHYRVKKSNNPLLYFDSNLFEDKKEDKELLLSQKVNHANVKTKQNVQPKKNAQQKDEDLRHIIPLSEKHGRLQPFWFAKNLLSYDVISFDVFDTLIFRPVKNPTDVFILVGEELGIIDFVEIRKNAEKRVREINKAKTGSHEVSLLEIYEEIEKKTGLCPQDGMKTEIDIEYKMIYPNPYMKCVFDILKHQGKKIIAVSDMYLSHENISTFLHKCGYEVDELFVSSEYFCNKRNCGLYKQVLGKYPNKKIIHIGDNHKTDIENARSMGIEASFYRNCLYIGEENYNIKGMSELIGSVYTGLVYNTLFNGKDKFNPYFEYGYLYGGLYILGFCNWIKKQAEKDGVDKIFFLARDGFIYQKIFDMISDDIKSAYVYWSRIASVLGNIEDNRYDFYKRLVDHKAVSVNKTTIKEVLQIIGISSEELGLNNYKLTEEMILCNENKAYFEDALRDNFTQIIEKNSRKDIKTREMLEELIGDSKKIAVVDVGWTGSSDLAIRNLVENKYKLNCKVECYLAASKVKGNLANITECMDGIIKTYMFSQINNRELYDYHVSANKGSNSIYFELFTQACMPSFKGISKEGDFEFDVAEVENYEMIKEIHKGIVYFVQQYLAIAKEFPILLEIPGYDAYIPYKYISSNLDYIKKYFGKFSYARGVGGNMKIETIEEIIKNIKL